MEELLIFPAIAILLAGPVALIWAIVLARRVRNLEMQLRRRTVPKGLPAVSTADNLVEEMEPATAVPDLQFEDHPDFEVQPVEDEPAPTAGISAPLETASKGPPPIPKEARTEEALPPLPVCVPEDKQPEVLEEKAVSGPAAVEKFIGIKALNWAGVITTLFAVAFGLKVAYDKGWLGEWGVSGLVYAAGAAFIVLGHVLRRRGFGIVSEGLSALGFGVLYAASYCARHLFDILSPEAAFTVMTLTTVCGAILTALYRSQIIAGLIFLGGYLTPVLLSTGEDHGGFLTAYLALLGACSLAFTFAWRWTFVKMLCPAATYLIFFGWYQQFGGSRTGIALTGTAVFFFLFSLSAVLPHLLKRVKDRWDDAGLALGNGLICFAFLFDILYDDHRTAMALTAFGLSVLFLAQFILVQRRGEKESFQAVAALALCVGLFTAAIPIEFGVWTTAVVWAIEGTFLLAMGFALRSRWILVGAAASHGLALWKLLHHFPLHDAAFDPLFNAPFFAWALAMIAFAAAAWRSWRERLSGEENPLNPQAGSAFFLVYTIATGALLYTLCASEIIAHFEHNLDAVWRSAMPYVWLSGALISALYTALSVRIKDVRPAFVGLVFYVVTAYSFIISFTSYHMAPFTLFLNPAFLCGMAIVGSLAFAAWLQRRATWENRDGFFAVLAFAAGGMAYLIGAYEVIKHFDLNLDLSWRKAMPYAWLVGTFISLQYAGMAARRQNKRLAVMSATYYGTAFTVFMVTVCLHHRAPFTPVFNPLFLCGTALALSYLFALRLPFENATPALRRLSFGAFIVALFLLFSVESYQYFDLHPALSGEGSLWALASLSVLWALFGAVLLIFGFARKAPLLRYTALGLFGITLVKVFLMDTASLDPLHRVLGFLTLGGVLIAGSFAYNRFLHIQKESK